MKNCGFRRVLNICYLQQINYRLQKYKVLFVNHPILVIRTRKVNKIMYSEKFCVTVRSAIKFYTFLNMKPPTFLFENF